MTKNIADRVSWWRRWDLHIHTNASDGKGTCANTSWGIITKRYLQKGNVTMMSYNLKVKNSALCES